jgi:hypothetical protein
MDILTLALVGHKHQSLYLNSATFHAQIEVMARMIPIIVDALAVSAEEEDREIKARCRMLEVMPQGMFVSKDEAARWLGLPTPTPTND